MNMFRNEIAPRRLTNSQVSNNLAASVAFTIKANTDYRIAAAVAGVWAKFAATVAANDALSFLVSPGGDLYFNSGTATQIAVIAAAAGAFVSITELVKQGD
jgi:anthranilate phosphoribosyltransferase